MNMLCNVARSPKKILDIILITIIILMYLGLRDNRCFLYIDGGGFGETIKTVETTNYYS